MNRDKLLAEAIDLDHVCRNRDLDSREIFQPNAFYGNDLVLKRYAGLPAHRPLKIVVPHGIVFEGSFVWEMERRAQLPAVFAYSDARAQAYARATRKLPIRTCVPFAYLQELLGDASRGQRKGTLYFPSHSSHRATAHADLAGMAKALSRLEDKYQPVTICIYWRDFELGHQQPFLDRGLRVVSAGHIFDPAFLFRLYYLCQQHRYASGNHVGSSLFYSVLAGCSFFLLSGFGATYSGDQAHLAQDLSSGGPLLGEIAAAFAVPADHVTPRQWALVARVCGLDRLLSQEELRSNFSMAERLDRIGVARDPSDGGIRFAMPRAGWRSCTRSLRAARRVASRLARGGRFG